MTIIVSPAAGDDIRAAYTYYAARNPDLAGRVVRTIIDALEGLRQFPLMGRVGAVPGTRERILTRYPYRIVYKIDGDRIEVARVLHMAQQWPDAPRE